MVRDPDAKHRRLAAIVFTDIVGFSALVNRDEVLGARALDLQRRIVRRLVPAFGGREIETAGDSFLLEFTSTFAALRCVVAIQQALKSEPPAAPGDPKVLLRASIHLGDIDHRQREVFGDGVNIAARLLPMSPEGGLAMSDQVHSQIRHRLDVAAHSLGPCELKNIRYPVEVFVFDAVAVSAIPAEVAGAAEGRQLKQRQALRFAPMAATALLVFVAGLWALQMLRSYLGTEPAEALPQRIAVLPFASFSKGEGDELIASGLQDSILTNLARVDALRVISRTSVQPYKDTSTRKIRDIATELGVDSIIEGSLQRNGDRMMVQVQLIDAATDHHLWAQTYDRHIDDLFSVQSAIARDVAQAVKVRFAEPQSAAVDTQPTQNVAAWTEYQKALVERDGDSSHRPAMQAALDRALALDPKFALALIAQADLHIQRYYDNEDRSEARLLLAKQALIRAAELQPNLPELHRGWGNYYADGRRDLEAAVAEYETALQLMPNDAETLNAIGNVYQEQDRLTDALVVLRRAAEMAPRSIPAQINVISTLELMRNYRAAEMAVDKIAMINPKSQAVPVYHARLALVQGDLARTREWMKQITYAPALERLNYYLGDIDEAIRQIKLQPEWQDSGTGAAAYPIVANLAVALWIKGDEAAAREQFSKVVTILEPMVKADDSGVDPAQDPAPWDQRLSLAMAYAALGKADPAKALVELVQRENCCPSPISRADILSGIALTEILLGDKTAAIAAIDRLLSESSFVSRHYVAIDPIYRPLHAEPAFSAMLERAQRRESDAASATRTAALH